MTHFKMDCVRTLNNGQPNCLNVVEFKGTYLLKPLIVAGFLKMDFIRHHCFLMLLVSMSKMFANRIRCCRS